VASAKIKFTTANLNNQRIHFQIYDENNNLKLNDGGDYNHPWILILNCIGLKN
jgi:hypothetical protein